MITKVILRHIKVIVIMSLTLIIEKVQALVVLHHIILEGLPLSRICKLQIRKRGNTAKRTELHLV